MDVTFERDHHFGLVELSVQCHTLYGLTCIEFRVRGRGCVDVVQRRIRINYLHCLTNLEAKNVRVVAATFLVENNRLACWWVGAGDALLNVNKDIS